MPGIKRKGGSESGSVPAVATSRRQTNGKGKHLVQPAVSEEDSDSSADDDDDDEEVADEDDDFDDGEDLLAGATGGGAVEQDGDDVEMFSDEDMDGGFVDVSGDAAEDHSTTTRRPNGKHASLFAIPSRDEMSQLKNTSELFKSNIFRLKIDEMLQEVRPKYDRTGALDFTLRHLKTLLEGLAPIGPAVLPKATAQLAKMYKSANVRIPFPSPAPKQDSPLKFAFERPTKVQIVGSWILKTAALRPEGVDVDLLLTMPSSLFQEKDYMNFRYFYKRAFYLSVIASAIATDDTLGLDCSFASDGEDARRTYLVLRPQRGGDSQRDFTKTKAFIKVHLAHEPDVFAPARLSPLRNSVRLGRKDGEDDDDASAALPPTPRYNASVLADQLYVQHMLYLNETASSCNAFADAATLLKTWASQRALGSGAGKGQSERRMAIGSTRVRFLLTMILAHLLNGADRSHLASTSANTAAVTRLSPGFSSYQLFRGVLDFLAGHDFEQEPLFMKAITGIISRRDKISAQDFLDVDKPHVMVDPTGSVNLLAALPAGSLAYLQRSAKATLALLSDVEQDNFDQVFLRDRSTPLWSFDDSLTLALNNVKVDAHDKADFGSNAAAAVARVCDTVKQGLTTRQMLVTAFATTASVQTWSVSSAPSPSSHVELAFNIDPAQAYRLVDHGPRPEDAAAAEAYKAFWGDRSELRRFRDGRIVESVVWTARGPFEKLSIPRRIVRYVLQRHHGVRLTELDFNSAAYEALLMPDDGLARQVYVSPPRELGFQSVQAAFDQLAGILRGLDNLPLSLISIVPSDAALRSTSVMVPAAMRLQDDDTDGETFCASHMPASDVVVTFESSGSWPDDLAAIQAMKLAFFEAMVAPVTAALPAGSRACIVRDHDAEKSALCDSSALEVIHGAGFAFRCRLYHVREQTILQRTLDDKNASPFAKTRAATALDRFAKRFEHGVRHHNHIAALAQRHTSFPAAVRLLSRWVECQLFGSQVTHESLELLAASVYIEAAASNTVAGSGHTGFLQCLRRLAEWNWRTEPLTVALAGATSATPSYSVDVKTRKTIDAAFAQLRAREPGMHRWPWFMATEDECRGVCWTRDAPVAGTADALQRLARAACAHLRANGDATPTLVKSLFVPSLAHYDFVVHLEPAAVNRYVDSLSFDAGALATSQKRFTLPSPTPVHRMAGMNTGLEMVRLLESLYADSVRLFYDSVGGTVIGGMWNPLLTGKSRAFRVGLGFNSLPDAQPTSAGGAAATVTLNQKAILDEIRRLGVGMVRNVVQQ